MGSVVWQFPSNWNIPCRRDGDAQGTQELNKRSQKHERLPRTFPQQEKGVKSSWERRLKATLQPPTAEQAGRGEESFRDTTNFLERFISQVGKEFLAIQWLKSFWFLISNLLSIHTSVKKPNKTSLAYQDKQTNKWCENVKQFDSYYVRSALVITKWVLRVAFLC